MQHEKGKRGIRITGYLIGEIAERFTKFRAQYPLVSESAIVTAMMKFYLPYAERGVDGNLLPFTLAPANGAVMMDQLTAPRGSDAEIIAQLHRALETGGPEIRRHLATQLQIIGRVIAVKHGSKLVRKQPAEAAKRTSKTM